MEIQIKYDGYIRLQEDQVKKFEKLESNVITDDIVFAKIEVLRLDARQKLNKIKPTSIGQASRISGVSPADISVLLIFIEQKNGKKED